MGILGTSESILGTMVLAETGGEGGGEVPPEPGVLASMLVLDDLSGGLE